MNTKIYSISLLVVSLTTISCGNNESLTNKRSINNVFATLDYDKTVAYNYNGQGDIEIIDKETGQLAKKIRKQVVLDSAQILKITNDLCDKSSYGGDVASCFDPHLGIVFYKTDKPVAYISICLDCNYLISSIKIPNSESGFSDNGIKRILEFERKIGY